MNTVHVLKGFRHEGKGQSQSYDLVHTITYELRHGNFYLDEGILIRDEFSEGKRDLITLRGRYCKEWDVGCRILQDHPQKNVVSPSSQSVFRGCDDLMDDRDRIPSITA